VPSSKSSIGSTLDKFTKGNQVNKSQLIDALAARYEGNRKQAAHALESVIDTITREVARGEKVAITGFGSFEKRVRDARWVRNPRTGERIKAKKTAIPKFSAGADLKAVVSGAKKLPKLTLTTAKSATSGTAKKTTTARKTTTASKTAATKAPAKKTSTTAKKTTATKAPAKKTSTTAKKTTATKAPAKKTSTTAKKTTATKAPAKKTSTTAKKTTATKAPAKKTTTAKTNASEAPAKKTATKRTAKKS
jgi:DNA-binding protein HU-beta